MATVSLPAAKIASRLKPSSVSLRFAIGDLRLGHVHLPVLDLNGHFLTQPLHIADLLTAQAETDGTSMIFGRSVVIDEASKPLLTEPSLTVIWSYPRYYVDLALSPAEYLAQFSSKSRSTLLRKVRKFEAAGGGTIDWSTFRSRDDVEFFLREALPLSERTYQHRLFRSGLSEAMRPAMERYADEHRFRAWLLRLGGQPIAYLYTPAVGQTLQYDYLGFDPAYGHLSPGTVLQHLVLQQLCAEREFSYFDFTEGEGEHKAFFGTHRLECADVLVPGSATYPRLVLATHRGFNRGARVLVAAIEKTGMKRKLRALLRRG
jgi:CelD/BcsL family acetyltransferase involved in cellulose biosynthesis